jgi:Domain of unknown function (DUF4129)
MATSKPRASLADYMTMALSPLLIMALIGSLVFFLLDVVYVGQYMGRLEWGLFWFIFAAVLVARISIELGSAKAQMYGLVLGIAVFLALTRFVEYPSDSPLAAFGWLLHLGLILLILWCASKLTWDCTHIDDAVTASGEGVLQAAGLDEAPPTNSSPSDSDESRAAVRKDKHTPALLTWWERYRKYQEEQQKKPHTPGVWVVYFSLAALPLYGLGQALIPVEETDRRRFAFWMMVSYVASGLGLLLTTSFLGLRRYLRQRNLKMPASMTLSWLLMGGGLIAVVMLVGALLPRPYGEYRLLDFTPLGSKQRNASQYAVKRDSAGKDEGKASNDPSRSDDKAKDGSGTQKSNQGKSQTSGKSSGGNSSQEKSGSGKQKGDQQGGRNRDQSRGEPQSKNETQSDSKKDPEQRDRDGENDQDQSNEKKKKEQGAPTSSSSREQPRPSQTGRSDRSASNPVSKIFEKLGTVATFIKWIIFAVLAIAVVVLVLRSGLQYLANFTDWAKRLLAAWQAWWDRLFGKRTARAGTEAAAEMETPGRTVRPFAYFGNPFHDGRADQLSPDELARYSFDALQSWAWERSLGRQAEETPSEFASRLGGEVPALESDVRRLALLYGRVAYARGRLTPSSIEPLRQFWQTLESVQEKPLSA